MKLRRLLVICLLWGLIMPMGVIINAQDAPTPDLTHSAQRAPADTLIYFSIRTDRAYVEQMGSLGFMVAELMGETLPADNIFDLLNMLIEDEARYDERFEGENADSLIFSWLGDTFSVYVPTPTDFYREPPSVTVFQVRDGEKAKAFVEMQMLSSWMLESEYYTIEEFGDGTLYHESEDYFYEGYSEFTYVDDSYILVSQSFEAIEDFLSPTREARLAQSDGFSTIVGNLPADGYNFMGYLNIQPLVVPFVEMELAYMLPPSLQEKIDAQALASAFGVQGIGGTILDGRVLALDAVMVYGENTFLSALGLPDYAFPDYAPLDLSFAQSIPANAALYQQGAGAGRNLSAFVNSVVPLAEAFITGYLVPLGEVDSVEEVPLSFAVDMLNNAITQVSGLSSEAFFSMIDGQLGSYITNLDAPTPVFEIVLQNTTPADSQTAFDALEAFLIERGTQVIRDGNTLTVPASALDDLPVDEFGGEFPEVDDLVIRLSDSVWALGTGDSVPFAISQDGQSLGDVPAFIYMTQFYPPVIHDLMFIQGTALAGTIPPGDPSRGLFEKIDSLALVTTQGDGHLFLRATITLGE